MVKKNLVGDVPGNVLGMLGDLNFKLQHGVITPEQLDLFLKKQNPFGAIGCLDAILNREKELHQNFFGKNFAKEFDYSKFSATLERYGEAKFAEWRDFGLEPHFLPAVKMSQNRSFPGWKVKPENWFYEEVSRGKILENPLQLGGEGGQVVLADIRCKPSHSNGCQIWEKDSCLGDIIFKLREDRKISDYKIKNSRFGVSALEVENNIVPALARKLGLMARQVRSERAIEFNVLSQMLSDTPRVKDGETNTWVWFADHFKSDGGRFFGGSSEYDGLADVSQSETDYHWRISFRLLVVL